MRQRGSSGKHAFLVAAGILLSRLAGLVRVRVFSYYFGLNSDAADAFNQAFRIPNFLQNLFGEGVLSASFIPVYAGLRANESHEEARRVAGAVFAILALLTSVLVLFGVLATPLLIDLIAPGFTGEKRELTIHLVRILFPGAGLLVLSAWCLGVLNSHRKFFLSYTAPVLWNAAMIAGLVMSPHGDRARLAMALAWASVAGSLLQFAIQLPAVLRLLEGLRPVIHRTPPVRMVIINFFPVFLSRGVVQISGYVDSILASLLPTGAVTGLTNAQLLYLLPVSLFGMSVSAAELPAMSSATGSEEEIAAYLRSRLNDGLKRIAFFIVPSAMAFLALGDVVAATLLETGRFRHTDAMYVWGILAGSAVGLLASTMGRLYSSTYYALRDTRTPLRFAIVRVVLTTALGWFAAIMLPPLIGLDRGWGVAGLTASAGMAGWIEFTLLRRALNRRIGTTGLSAAYLARLWCAAIAGGAVAWAIKLAVGHAHPLLAGALILTPFGGVYLAVSWLLGIEEVRSLTARVMAYADRR